MKKIFILFFILVLGIVIYYYSKFNYPKPYALVNSNVAKYAKQNEDSKGIPLLKFKGRNIYYPINISQVALHYYKNYYETNNENSKKYFLKLAQWHLNNFTDNGKWGGWYCEDNLRESSYNLPSRWISAMSQGFGLSVMIEAYGLTKNKRYLDIAKKVLNSFEISTVDGGISSNWGNNIWFEEYPTTPQKHVLNGFIFALAGLYDYYKYTKNEKAKILFEDGITALKEHISSFDAGFNSYYSMSENVKLHTIASATGWKYHHLHIAQLLWVYTVTGDEYFKSYAHKFLQQDFGDTLNYGLQKRIKNIKATNTIEPKNYGTDNLDDSIWTYGKYWSTYKFPTKLKVSFNRFVRKLNGFTIVTTGADLDYENMDLYAVLADNEKIKLNFKLLDKQIHKTRHHIANVQRFGISTLALKNKNINSVIINFKSYKHGKVLAIRELNFYYDMNHEINILSNILNYKSE
ncbi:D-glucuronyl C5-epimerase family protein [Halarcobacter anaerophilus]|uniref:D-glucuronyl C5-epimerase C-terminal domain-containing protein n=1 Tax=Halarcobacter anaerophilus TaxID=877500 RepID=A0A4Q0Y3N0_9BACT|nr:D-glucuronyl C5-epimerase family protein [Halarcobacter anaerophilus]QDF29513.1 C5-epim_C domain-containing protein [Halarcobacter anaerophilus]RXJ64752.1 hypothetical protein CRV06_02010 [Halarcobacter anaerophilus]